MKFALYTLLVFSVQSRISLALCIIPLCERLILAVRQQNFAGSYLPPISHDCNLSKPRLFDATAEPGNVAFHDVFMKKRETTRGQAIAIFIPKFVDRICKSLLMLVFIFSESDQHELTSQRY
jgi:hypothetical protein